MKLAALVALCLALSPGVSQACSPIAGYRVPTNIELLERADLVVLARTAPGPQSCRQSGDRQYCQGSVILSPQRVLKGDAPARLLVEGSLSGRRGHPYLPQYTPLDRPHDSVLWGACIRQAYADDTLVLALFRERDGEMRQLGEAFARAVEDVEGPHGLWVRAAELYLRLQEETPPADRRQAFTLERDRLRAIAGDADAQAIAADIDAYLVATAGDASPGISLPSNP